MTLGHKAYFQTATYWGSPTQGGFGNITYATPRVIKVRWEDRVETFTTIEGQELRSKAIVYAHEHLELGGYLIKGDSTGVSDPTTLRALEIQRSDDVPDLRGLNTEYRMFL